MVAGPDIYGVNSANNLKEVQRRAKESLENLTLQQMLEDLEAKVTLNETEKAKNKLRIVSYATDSARGGAVDKGDGKGPIFTKSKKIYEMLVAKIKDTPGYLPPTDKEAKVFYDISFRLKQLGYDKNSKGEKLNFTNEYNNDFAIAVMAFQKMSGAKKIESIVGPETLWKLLQGDVKGEQNNSSATNASPTNQTTEGTSTATISAENQLPETAVLENTEEDKINKKSTTEKKFDEFVALSNTVNNITQDELDKLDELEGKVNRNEKMYIKFENTIVKQMEKTYADKNVKTFDGSIQYTVKNLLDDFSKGYLDQSHGEPQERELDSDLFYAIKSAIVEILSAQYVPLGDEKKDAKNKRKFNQQKRRLIYFVRSFTGNFNDELAKYEKTLDPIDL